MCSSDLACCLLTQPAAHLSPSVSPSQAWSDLALALLPAADHDPAPPPPGFSPYLMAYTLLYSFVWEERVLPIHLDLEAPNKFMRVSGWWLTARSRLGWLLGGGLALMSMPVVPPGQLLC